MQVNLKDKPNKETENHWLKSHIFEHGGFHIEGEYQLIEPNRPIPKFQSSKEVAEKIKKFIDSRKNL